MKILFFTAGRKPTAEETACAKKLDAQVCFRNAKADALPVEACDGVAGCVPEAYKAMPRAEDAIADNAKQLAERTKIVGGMAKRLHDALDAIVKPLRPKP